MSDEIKEILDIEKYRNKDGYVENISLLPSEIHKLLDYITNLQDENESLAKDVDFWRTKYNEEFNEALYLTVYKSRCEKAIEYIKKHQVKISIAEENELGFCDEFDIFANPSILLNILNGGDK